MNQRRRWPIVTWIIGVVVFIVLSAAHDGLIYVATHQSAFFRCCAIALLVAEFSLMACVVPLLDYSFAARIGMAVLFAISCLVRRFAETRFDPNLHASELAAAAFVVFLLAQLPFWVARFLWGWRIERNSLRNQKQFGIRDVWILTAAIAVPLAALKLNMDAMLVAALIGVGASIYSLVLVAPLLHLAMSKHKNPWSLLLLFFSAFLPMMLAIIELGVLSILFMLLLLGIQTAAWRAMQACGYRLVSGRDGTATF